MFRGPLFHFSFSVYFCSEAGHGDREKKRDLESPRLHSPTHERETSIPHTHAVSKDRESSA